MISFGDNKIMMGEGREVAVATPMGPPEKLFLLNDENSSIIFAPKRVSAMSLETNKEMGTFTVVADGVPTSINVGTNFGDKLPAIKQKFGELGREIVLVG
jgi:hypothetical protein